ncbi:MAG: MaoC/PaaZ C-terminal domain-containing protein [Pseudomonadota bacterium]
MAIKEVFFEDVKEGSKMPEFVSAPLSEVQFVMYAGASGDFNPLHTVHAFGEKAGYGGVIGHGMLSMGIAGQGLTEWLGNKALKKFSVSFRSPVKAKDVITVKGVVTKKYTEGNDNCIDIDVVAENQRGETVVTGNATAALSSK